jgi:hypothetical protein
MTMGFYNWQISPCGRNDEGIEPVRVLESLKWRQSRHFRLSKTLNFSLNEWVISTAGRNLLVLETMLKVPYLSLVAAPIAIATKDKTLNI